MSLWHLSMANGRWQMCFCEKVQEPPAVFFICNVVLPLLVFRPKTNIRFLYQCALCSPNALHDKADDYIFRLQIIHHWLYLLRESQWWRIFIWRDTKMSPITKQALEII